MPSSVPEFWQLVGRSQLLPVEHCRQLHEQFQATNGSTDHSSPQALADWLVAQNIFSRYQAAVLLAGRPGPFVYGDYTIYDRIESGRLAGGFRAVHGATGHPVLLRFLTGPIVQEPALWQMAASEAQVACTLVHPHLQRTFELVDLGAFKFLVEEDLHGETLAERLAATRMHPQEACRLARQIAQALAALHPTGRSHGDVRPLNVWLELAAPPYPEQVKVLRDPLTPLAPPNFAAPDPQGWLLAQSDYLAPEFQMPGRTADVLTDLYALGCTLYHMLAGHPPFPGGSAMQKMARHAGEAIRPLETYGVPTPLAQLVMYLMAKNPSLRYQDAQTVADQLTAFIEPSLAHLPPAPAPATLPAYEAALRQSQARLAAAAVQTTFGLTNQAPVVAQAPAPATAQGVAAAALPTGSIPVGKAVGAEPAPSFALKNEPSTEKSVLSPVVGDPALLAAKEAREKRKLITILVSVGVGLIALIVGINMMGRDSNAKPHANKPGEEESPPDLPEIDEHIGVQTAVDEKSPGPGKKAITLPQGFKPSVNDPPEKTSTRPSTTPPAESGAAYEVVADDGKLPWASPTAGKPIDLKYVPPLAGVFIVTRPASLLGTSEGPKALKALGPRFAAAQAAFEQSSKLKLADCERLIVSLHDNGNQFPKVSVVAHLKTPLEDGFAASLGGQAEKEEGQEFITAGTWAYYVPAEEKGRVLLMAAPDDVREAIKSPVPLLKREMEQVRRNTDAERHVTVLFDPTFVFSGEGDPLFAGEFARVKEPLRTLLGEGLQVGAFSLHFGDAFYSELRVQTKVDKRPQDLAEDFRKRLEQLPNALEDYFAGPLDPPQYWKKLANRLPGMIRQLHDETRVAAEGNQAVINAVLPGPAGHNLLLATELTISTAPGAGSTTTVAAAGSGPKTIEDAVKMNMKSFSFDNLPLEFTMRDLAIAVQDDIKGAPFEFAIRIIGEDLQLEGITRNQPIRDFKQENKTVGEVLTAVVMKANPVTTVKSPTETDQKLIWVIGADPDDKKTKVIITTRAGAAKRGYKLPAVFGG
jgi:hypothetical protein